MICQKCGKEIKEGIKFCPYCGSNCEQAIFANNEEVPVVVPVTKEKEKVPEVAPEPEKKEDVSKVTPEPKKKKKGGCAIVIIILLSLKEK